MTLTDQGDVVKGGGVFSNPSVAISFSISGSNSDTTCSLRVTSTGYLPIDFTGVITTDTTMQASLNGSGFGYYSILVYRRP